MTRVIGLLLAVAYVVGLAWWLIAVTDWEAVLRFVAPTAFETRSLEELATRKNRV